MNVAAIAKTSVLTQPVYEPGKPIDYVARELGLSPSEIIKLASNENPFGPSPLALAAARRALEQGALYPDGGCYDLRQRLARRHGLDPSSFVVGNGSNEIIELLGHVFLGPGDEVVMAKPAFVVYRLVTLLFGAQPVEVPLSGWRHDLDRMAAAVTPRTKMVCVCTPNNPTGTANSADELHRFVASLPEHVVVVVDEAYCEYLESPPDLRPLILSGRPVIGLRTFSKIFGLASLRVGYGYGAPEIVSLLQRVRQPFNVNAIGQAAAVAALDDEGFVRDCREQNRAGLSQLSEGLGEIGVSTVPSVANFLLAKVGNGQAAFEALQRLGLIVRPMTSYGLPEWIRISVGNARQNGVLIGELGNLRTS